MSTNKLGRLGDLWLGERFTELELRQLTNFFLCFFRGKLRCPHAASELSSRIGQLFPTVDFVVCGNDIHTRVEKPFGKRVGGDLQHVHIDARTTRLRKSTQVGKLFSWQILSMFSLSPSTRLKFERPSLHQSS